MELAMGSISVEQWLFGGVGWPGQPSPKPWATYSARSCLFAPPDAVGDEAATIRREALVNQVPKMPCYTVWIGAIGAVNPCKNAGISVSGMVYPCGPSGLT
eukprot:1153840-Pelagomonas_calceolata.AAC.7